MFYKKLLKKLQWNKWVLATILMAVNGYLLSKWVYGEVEFTLIATVIWALFKVASIQTKKLGNGDVTN